MEIPLYHRRKWRRTVCFNLSGLQKSQSNAIKAFEVLDKPGSPWQGIGLLGLLTAILILSFYSVVGGWILNFTVFSFTGAFDNLTTENAGSLLAGVFSSPLSNRFIILCF